MLEFMPHRFAASDRNPRSGSRLEIPQQDFQTLNQPLQKWRTRLPDARELVGKAALARADLVAAVLAVINQRLLKAIHLAHRGGNDRQPFVMHPLRRKRCDVVQQRTPERERGAGGEVAPQQRLERAPGMDQCALATGDFQRLEQPAVHVTAGFVHQPRVRMQQQQFRAVRELRQHQFDLVRMPEIILIAQEHDVAVRVGKCGFEVADKTEIALVAREHPADAARLRFFRLPAEQREGAIARGIVARHDLVGYTRLREQAAPQFRQPALTVVGAEHDRN